MRTVTVIFSGMYFKDKKLTFQQSCKFAKFSANSASSVHQICNSAIQKCAAKIRRRSSTVLSSMSHFLKTLALIKRGAICRSEKKQSQLKSRRKIIQFFGRSLTFGFLSRSVGHQSTLKGMTTVVVIFCFYLIKQKIAILISISCELLSQAVCRLNPVNSRFYPF